MDWNTSRSLGDVLVDQIERQQRMAQVVEHADEQHEVEPFARARRRRTPTACANSMSSPSHLGGEARLRQIVLVEIDARPRAPRRAASSPSRRSRRCSRCRARSCPARSAGIASREAPPFHAGIVAEEMFGRGLHAAQVDVVEPRARARARARGCRSSVQSGSALRRPHAAGGRRARSASVRFGDGRRAAAHRLAIAVQRADIDIARCRRARRTPRRRLRARH